MVFYKFPFNGTEAAQVKDKIINSEVKFPKDHPTTEELADVLRGLLHKDPAQRYDLYTVKTHKWMLLSDSAI